MPGMPNTKRLSVRALDSDDRERTDARSQREKKSCHAAPKTTISRLDYRLDQRGAPYLIRRSLCQGLGRSLMTDSAEPLAHSARRDGTPAVVRGACRGKCNGAPVAMRRLLSSSSVADVAIRCRSSMMRRPFTVLVSLMPTTNWDCGKAERHVAVGSHRCWCGPPIDERAVSGGLALRAHHSPGLLCWAEHFVRGRRLRGRRRGQDAELHERQIERTDRFLSNYPPSIRGRGWVKLFAPVAPQHGLAMRLALSCLVDADHTDTARFDTGREMRDPPAPRWKERLAALEH